MSMSRGWVVLACCMGLVPGGTRAEVRELCGVGSKVSFTGSNERGQLVGVGLISLDARAILCQDGARIELGTLGGATSAAEDVNEAGHVAGYSQTAGGATHPFLWIEGQMQDLGTLGTGDCRALRLDDEGRVAGTCQVEDGVHAFLWEDGAMQDLGTLGGPESIPSAIGPQGQVVGRSTTAAGETHAFSWRGGELIDLGTLGGGESRAVDVNASGWIAGDATTASGETHAALWGPARVWDLGTLGGDRSEAVGLDDSGRVAGHSRTATGETHAFLWSGGTMRDLGALPVEEFPPNPTPLPTATVLAQNELGEVTGTSNVGGTGMAFLAGLDEPIHTLSEDPYTIGLAVNAFGEVIVRWGTIVIRGQISVVPVEEKAHRLVRYFDVAVANRSIGAAHGGLWRWFRVITVRRLLAMADAAVSRGDTAGGCALLAAARDSANAHPGELQGVGAARLDGLIANLNASLACPEAR